MSTMSVKMKCSCEFDTNEAVIDKIRSIGAQNRPMPSIAHITCECGESIEMNTLVFQCPHCAMTYGITPCSAEDHSYIVKAGINY